MNFYFDESGDFRVPPDPQEHAVGIVIGVVVPETRQAVIWQRFQALLGTLPPSAFKKGEPKGNSLDADGRRAFAALISESEGILVCPILLDLTSIAGRAEALRNAVAAKLEEWAALCLHETMRQEVLLLRRQVGNLSPEVTFRLAAWAQCIMRCIDNSIVGHSGPEFHGCWGSLRFEIDAVCRTGGNREEQVFPKLLPSWVTAWSVKRPFTLIEELHTESHPFVRNWDTDRGVDLGKMLRGNVHFCASEQSIGIQLADMAASLVRKAVVGVVSTFDLDSYGLMMLRALGRPTHAHGIFSFAELDPTDLSRRYHGLVHAMENARKGRSSFPVDFTR
jgi:hypothetical protein